MCAACGQVRLENLRFNFNECGKVYDLEPNLVMLNIGIITWPLIVLNSSLAIY